MPTTRRAAAAKAAPVEEPEDEFEEMEEVDGDDDLEELEEEEPEEAPAPKRRAKKATTPADGEAPAKRTPPKRPEIQYSSAWLAAHVTEKTGETYDARGIRMLLRKLASTGKLSRVVGEDRNRYEFSGPDDPTVKDVMDFVTSGAAKELKQAGLQAVKDKAAAKKAAAKAAKAKTEAEAEDEQDQVDAEAEDVEDDELEEEAPAPKPVTRRRAAAPAKATPAGRRRAPAKA